MLGTTTLSGDINRPKVVVNFPYYFDTHSSMGVFFKDLYEALVQNGVEVLTACLNTPVEIPVKSYITPTKAKHKLLRFFSYYWQLSSFMRKNSSAVLLNISQEFAFTPCPSRTVTIVHDLIQLRYPRTWWIRSYIRFMLRFIRHSRLNIAVSATTQARLRQHGIQSTVLYNWFSVKLPVVNETAAQEVYDGLFVGNQLPHKNMLMFLRLVRRFPDRKFAAIVPKMAHREISMFGPVPNLTIFSDLGQHDYFRVIAQSRTLVSPSLDEGFGRPPMEASLAGVNLLLSDIPIYRELYNGLAVFFALGDENDLFTKFININSGCLAPPRGKGQMAKELMLTHRGDPQEYVQTILANSSAS
jgi:hypothetical protein